MLYCCETCRKKFNKEEDALACETKHEEAKKERFKLKAERDARIKEIEIAQAKVDELVGKFGKDYGIGRTTINPYNLFELFLS